MFSQANSIQIFIFLILFYGVFVLIEFIYPHFIFYYNKTIHFQINILFTLIGISIYSCMFLLLVFVSQICHQFSIGIFQVITLPTWVQLLITILIYDLISGYFFHWLSHKISYLWQIHAMHHTDSTVDVSTSFRNHPIEFIIQFLFFIFATFIIGPSINLIINYLILYILFTQFNHANIKLAPWLNRLLGFIFITPDMHKIHHHFILPQRNSNYGNIFSFWDRFFGTFNNTPIYKIKFGLAGIKDNLDGRFLYQINIPFLKKLYGI